MTAATGGNHRSGVSGPQCAVVGAVQPEVLVGGRGLTVDAGGLIEGLALWKPGTVERKRLEVAA